ncbi:hypothetical protein CA13_15230 [Planctomycetes bacterium CA13]|uniref:Squalene cyclase C-terminal domain-containing protein n=2 Tax=Novipirellula herctigrandis TaxID=2527986 RepID=A0A5C5YYU2_9BACT|nr:hypothetical protein CA13_15230 [Planctomycetes bacterium CA13]
MWADPRLVYSVAAIAVALLLVTIWLFRRGRKQGRQAGVVCLFLSVALHLALVFLIPMLAKPSGGAAKSDPDGDEAIGIDEVAFSTFDPDMQIEDFAASSAESEMAPLPLAAIADLLESPSFTETLPAEEILPAEAILPAEEILPAEFEEPNGQPDAESTVEAEPAADVPASLVATDSVAVEDLFSSLDADFAKLMQPATIEPAAVEAQAVEAQAVEPAAVEAQVASARSTPRPEPTATPPVRPATVVGQMENDFANRVGQAKTEALIQTGGSLRTEAAVAAALRFLAQNQRPDGSWSPAASGAGIERNPLGMARPGAGKRCETAITGLALLTMMGAGNTHQNGDYADNVYKGLAYMIGQQKADGSLAGNATVYESTYSHGMAALAMCEAAAITHDPSAVESARRAMNYSRRMQHPSSGGWRYTVGDTGDLSQLGWQAMVMDAGARAGVPPGTQSVRGIERFLDSVRLGRSGGLACYRPGEAPSRTMTAEALATRLLIGQTVSPAAVGEAEQYLLQQKPGAGQDNYYYWYYATLALHQLQDDAWSQWNEALQQRLLSTQLSDGRWPTNSVWGGYGGSVYTTSMATLCLETYYRHSVRDNNTRIGSR